MKTVVSLLAVAGLAAAASAQTYESGGANVVFEVWDGSAWSSSVNVLPGSTVEWRARVQYVGARTDLNGMGEMWWQATFGGADNTGAGASADQVSVGQGVPSGNSVPGSMVSEADGANGGALGIYGRVLPFGLAATNAASSNVTTVFRHSGGGSVPAGEWIRVAGSGSSVWAPSLDDTSLSTTTANTQLLLRGIQSNQTSEASSVAIHSESLNPVVFRGSFTASDDTAIRTVVVGTDERFLRRVGGNTSSDNRRYIAWQTSQGDTGTSTTGHRTFANGFFSANINIVPTPASIALMGLGGLIAARRRRA
jgi:hypothetical protein